MIKHHPTDELLHAFSAGELSSSLSVAISTHTEMCSVCRHQVDRYTQELSNNSFSDAQNVVDFAANTDDFILDSSLSDMLSNIMEDKSIERTKLQQAICVGFGSFKLDLPKSLRRLNLSKFFKAGKIARARINLDEEPTRTSLLHIQAGGKVPEHTHKGFEITLLLEGFFEDEMGDYVPGDFIILDSKHKHHPTSKKGCWCLTVVNDSIQFTKGANRLLNPFGKYIY